MKIILYAGIVCIGAHIIYELSRPIGEFAWNSILPAWERQLHNVVCSCCIHVWIWMGRLWPKPHMKCTKVLISSVDVEFAGVRPGDLNFKHLR